MITAAELANAVNRLPDPNTFSYDSIQIILHNVLEPSVNSKNANVKTTYMQQSTVTFVRRNIFGVNTWTLESAEIKNTA